MDAISSDGLSYAPVGCSRPGAETPRGLRARTQRIRLGDGREVWERACEAVAGWAIKKQLRFRIAPDDERVELGRDYDTRYGVGVARVREPVRVVWVADEPDRRGFGYGTRAGHPITGEECFLAERDAHGGVWLVVRTVSRVSRGRWLPLWPGIRIAQPYFQRSYARAAVRLVAGAGADAALRGVRGLRRGLVGEGSSSVDGIARLGYGMGAPRGPFEEPPVEPVELDRAALPWELRDDEGDTSSAL